jgi:cell division protein ZipA
MPELRIILLVAGVVFVAALVGYEWWRSRGARPAALPPRDYDNVSARDLESGGLVRDESSTRSAPTPLPEINFSREARSSVGDALPVIDIDTVQRSSNPPDKREDGIAVSDDVAVDRPTEATSTQAILRSHDEPYIGQDDDVSEPRVILDAATEADSRGPQIVLQWANEAERRIVTLRVLPRGEPRFPGRALRQAFASAGFWHGPLDIFHLPDADGRVILSVAALAQPGTFDPSIMDSQRFSGLNMFAVLPGPIPERHAFEQLVHAARQIAERLDGQITDQHGQELTPDRIARLRQSLEGPAIARVAGES